ncbi:acetyl-CoA acetyltransferase [Nocardioides marmoriginsengisoli]|uniref:Acetyl-CoA acetyltransferase n=1 Tax=Nocardioides marmoriginsengisoli TaxID=661483 RepID=A0A3N0CLJ9_9ACTN|nr:acetyl-CoA acetyltransferase [Nocardioides marmoriginsengisoli]RNL64300.1 acetyl-CoA acetyltransferase [Nocardioides marmoriginsengisoli]
MAAPLDPSTPVLIGVGQSTDPFGSADYAALSSVELAAAAASAALEDCGTASIAGLVDVLACVRPMELSTPLPPALGASSNFPRAVAQCLGLEPEHAVLESVGGQSPQQLVSEYADRISAGEHQAVLIAGGESLSTQAHFTGREDAPDFSDDVTGPWEDRGANWEFLLDDNLIAHGLFIASAAYALMDHARRGRLGLSVEEYRREMGRLFAPFSEVAAANPLASTRTVRTAAELAAVTADNPLIYDPYPRWTVAREKVNLGAAVVITSVEVARRCGVPEDQWVYLHGHADAVEAPLLERPDLGGGPVSVQAVRAALAMAGIGPDDLTALDLYSCFAIPVFNITDALGIEADDPRGLTVTGGLPFFGGPGNNYSLHAIAETVRRLRTADGFGLVGANGGLLSKYSVGVYSSTPTGWSGRGPVLTDQGERLAVAARADGPGVVETYTFPGTGDAGVVVGRLDATGERFVAMAPVDDPLLALLRAGDGIGARVTVTSADGVNSARTPDRS